MMSDFELVCESTKSPKCVGEVGTDFIAAAGMKKVEKLIFEKSIPYLGVHMQLS